MGERQRQRVGRMIHDHRERYGLTQRELAEKAGCSLSTIQNVEAGIVGYRKVPLALPGIERALNLPVGYLAKRWLVNDDKIPPEFDEIQPDEFTKNEQEIWELDIPEVIRRAMIKSMRQNRGQHIENWDFLGRLWNALD